MHVIGRLINSVIEKIKTYKKGIIFLIGNILCIKQVPLVVKSTYNISDNKSIRLDRYNKRDMPKLREIHKEALGCDLSLLHRILISLMGHKLCYLLRNENDSPIAFILFYFTKKDRKIKLIHLGTIAVDKNNRGCGLGNILLDKAITNLKRAEGLAGISSRVSLNNESSLRLHFKYNFITYENYHDIDHQEQRAYLILHFSK